MKTDILLIRNIFAATTLLALAGCASTSDRAVGSDSMIVDGQNTSASHVMITGSRIRRDAETVKSQGAHLFTTFTIVVDREALDSTGEPDLATALRKLDPAVR
jgi:starvation-inducible outer membrane lipoprotein